MLTQQNLLQLFSSLLSPSDAQRLHGEKQIQNLINQNPQDFISESLPIISAEKVPQKIKLINLILLKKLLQKKYSQQNQQSNFLPPEFLSKVFNDLLQFLKNFPRAFLAENVCQCVSHLIALISLSNPQRAQLCLHSLSSQHSQHTLDPQNALRVWKWLLCSHFHFYAQNAERVVSLLRANLQGPDPQTFNSALELFKSVLVEIPVSQCAALKSLPPLVLRNLLSRTTPQNIDFAQNCFRHLQDIFQWNSLGVFRPSFDLLLQCVRQAHQTFPNSPELRFVALESVVSLCEFYPSLLSRDATRVVLQMLIENIRGEHAGLGDSQWAVLQQGYQHADHEDVMVKSYLDLADRVFCKLDSAQIDWLASELVAVVRKQQRLGSNRQNGFEAGLLFTALLLMSQLAEQLRFCEQTCRLVVNVSVWCAGCGDAALSYSCLFLLGRLSQDWQPEFQNRHHCEFVAVCLQFLENSKSRILGVCLDALINFFENL